MPGNLNDTKYISADVLVKKGTGVIKAVYVTLLGAASDKVEFKDGTDGTGTPIFTVNGESIQSIPYINKRFKTGIYADVTGSTARYLVVFE